MSNAKTVLNEPLLVIFIFFQRLDRALFCVRSNQYQDTAFDCENCFSVTNGYMSITPFINVDLTNQQPNINPTSEEFWSPVLVTAINKYSIVVL